MSNELLRTNLLRALGSFKGDPPDSVFQRAYLIALLDLADASNIITGAVDLVALRELTLTRAERRRVTATK